MNRTPATPPPPYPWWNDPKHLVERFNLPGHQFQLSEAADWLEDSRNARAMPWTFWRNELERGRFLCDTAALFDGDAVSGSKAIDARNRLADLASRRTGTRIPQAQADELAQRWASYRANSAIVEVGMVRYCPTPDRVCFTDGDRVAQIDARYVAIARRLFPSGSPVAFDFPDDGEVADWRAWLEYRSPNLVLPAIGWQVDDRLVGIIMGISGFVDMNNSIRRLARRYPEYFAGCLPTDGYRRQVQPSAHA